MNDQRQEMYIQKKIKLIQRVMKHYEKKEKFNGELGLVKATVTDIHKRMTKDRKKKKLITSTNPLCVNSKGNGVATTLISP